MLVVDSIITKQDHTFSHSQVYSSWEQQAAIHLCPLHLMLVNFICYVCAVENNGLNDD